MTLMDSLRTITPVVIDFEYTTPAGARPEPIEIAVQALRSNGDVLERGASWEALIRPPEHAGLTSFDIAMTGITPAMLADQPPASEVLAQLDKRFTNGPYVLIAHNAASEARLLFDYQQYCPNLARIDFLDTVKLARDLYPELSRHGLDSLLPHLGIARSPHRHRAMADVHATVEVFITMITSGRWSNLSQLRHVAHYSAKASQPEQISLFS